MDEDYFRNIAAYGWEKRAHKIESAGVIIVAKLNDVAGCVRPAEQSIGRRRKSPWRQRERRAVRAPLKATVAVPGTPSRSSRPTAAPIRECELPVDDKNKYRAISVVFFQPADVSRKSHICPEEDRYGLPHYVRWGSNVTKTY